MDSNEVQNEIWPDDMEATVAEEQTADSPTMIPGENQPENVDNQPAKEPIVETQTEPGESIIPDQPETETETGTTENQEGETQPEGKEVVPEVTESPIPEKDGELFTGIRTVLELPEDATPEQAVTYVKGLVEYRDKNRKANQELSALLVSEKSYANFTRELMSGVPLVVALARNFDMDSLKPEPGDEDYSKYKDAADARKAKVIEDNKAIQKLQENKQQTDTMLRTFATEEKLDEKGATEFFTSLENDLVNLQEGVITKEFLDRYKKGLRYDADIASAKNIATIAARNKKIVAEKVSNIAEQEPPSLQPSGNKMEPVAKDPNNWVEEIVDKFS
jgi:hypothetical protein